ncbi:MAG: hypothetical protein KAT79_05270 [candidate division Zixibacteria bacterium]|nr:hypothetical protein [candidate division Zixibacteria bacterium]
MDQLKQLDRDQLLAVISDFAKNWLAHDGLWFQAAEKQFGMETAIELDTEAWKRFTVIEAKRIMARHGIGENSGLEGLKKALGFRLYAVLNKQEFRNETDRSFEFYMVDCRVQSARKRKELPLFPCKSVGVVEYTGFAHTIDPRIKTECIGCPPDQQAGKEYYCGWRFTIES